MEILGFFGMSSVVVGQPLVPSQATARDFRNTSFHFTQKLRDSLLGRSNDRRYFVIQSTEDGESPAFGLKIDQMDIDASRGQ